MEFILFCYKKKEGRRRAARAGGFKESNYIKYRLDNNKLLNGHWPLYLIV